MARCSWSSVGRSSRLEAGMLRVHLGVEDWGRVRFAAAPAPVLEMSGFSRILVRQCGGGPLRRDRIL